MSGLPGVAGLPPGAPRGPQTAWVRVFSECCLGGAAPGPGLGRLPRKVLALNLNHLITNKTKKSWFGLKITVRIPVKYWFMCSFRLRTSFLGWSIKPLLSILLKISGTDHYYKCSESYQLNLYLFSPLKKFLSQQFLVTSFDDRMADCVLCIRW